MSFAIPGSLAMSSPSGSRAATRDPGPTQLLRSTNLLRLSRILQSSLSRLIVSFPPVVSRATLQTIAQRVPTARDACQNAGMGQLDAVYTHLWAGHGNEFAVLDRSLGPRSWTFLLDVAGAAGLGSHSIAADIGCGRGNHCFELARRFECQAIGIDLVLPPLKAAVLTEAPTPRVQFVQGNIEQLPIRTGSVDFVWCRDMLVHVRSLESAMRECSRILRGGGKMLAWVTIETELMEPQEAERLYAPLGIEPSSVSQQQLEASFASAGFAVSRAEKLGSELIEFYEERDGRASRELMRIARMRRMREQLIAAWGKLRYDTTYALYHWVIYHLLGKLSSGFYLLEKPDLKRK